MESKIIFVEKIHSFQFRFKTIIWFKSITIFLVIDLPKGYTNDEELNLNTVRILAYENTVKY